MQAVVPDSTSLGGGKIHGNASRMEGLPGISDPMRPLEDPADAFWQWVQELTGSDTPVEKNQKQAMAFKFGNQVNDSPTPDELQVLVTEAIDPPMETPEAFRALKGDHPADGQYQLPSVIINAIRAQFKGRQPDNPPSGQTAHPSTAMPVPKAIQSPVRRNGIDSPGILPITVKGEGHQPTEKPFELAAKSATLEMGSKNNSPIGGGGKPDTPVLINPEGPGTEGQKINARLVADRQLLTGGGNHEEARFSNPGPKQPFSGQAKGSDSTQTQPGVLTDPFYKEAVKGQPTESVNPAGKEATRTPASFQDGARPATLEPWNHASSSGDDTTDARDNAKSHRTQRIASAEGKETGSQKDQPMETIKGTPIENTRPNPSFQETAKAMVVEPSSTTTGKPVVGQSLASTQAQPSAMKTFQAAVMDQLIGKATIRPLHGRSEIQIRLKPEFLGNVQMNIATDKEQVVVRILTDQPVVKEIIETHLYQLKADLHNHGLTIDKFDIMVNPDAEQHHSREQFSQMFKNNSFQHGRRQPHEQEPDKGNPGRGQDNDADDGLPDHDGVNYFA